MSCLPYLPFAGSVNHQRQNPGEGGCVSATAAREKKKQAAEINSSHVKLQHCQTKCEKGVVAKSPRLKMTPHRKIKCYTTVYTSPVGDGGRFLGSFTDKDVYWVAFFCLHDSSIQLHSTFHDECVCWYKVCVCVCLESGFLFTSLEINATSVKDRFRSIAAHRPVISRWEQILHIKRDGERKTARLKHWHGHPLLEK